MRCILAEATPHARPRGGLKVGRRGLWSIKLRGVVSQGPRMPPEPFRTHTGVRLLWAQAATQRRRGRELAAETAEPGAQETVRANGKQRLQAWLGQLCGHSQGKGTTAEKGMALHL